MKKHSLIVIVILSIIILGLCAFIVYDKNLFGIKGESKTESNNVIEKKEITQNKNLKVGAVGNKDTKISLRMDENFYFYIKEGKVTFHKNDGSEIADSTISSKVIQIALGVSCDGSDARLAALTENGDVFYNKVENLTNMVTGNYDYSFDFDKVVTDGKVYGIEAITYKGPTTCGGTSIYAYTNETEKRIINVAREKNFIFIKASLGETYDERFPFKDYKMYFELGGPMLYIKEDGKLIFEDDSSIENGNIYLTSGDSYIYSKAVYDKHNEETGYTYIVDKNNKVYLLTLNKPTDDYPRYTYNVSDTGKTFKNIQEEKGSNDQIVSRIIEYTDGSSEQLY